MVYRLLSTNYLQTEKHFTDGEEVSQTVKDKEEIVKKEIARKLINEK